MRSKYRVKADVPEFVYFFGWVELTSMPEAKLKVSADSLPDKGLRGPGKWTFPCRIDAWIKKKLDTDQVKHSEIITYYLTNQPELTFNSTGMYNAILLSDFFSQVWTYCPDYQREPIFRILKQTVIYVFFYLPNDEKCCEITENQTRKSLFHGAQLPGKGQRSDRISVPLRMCG